MLANPPGEYSLGFPVEGAGGDLCFSHGGASSGYRCYLLAYLARHKGAVIMTNSEGGQGLYHEILRETPLQPIPPFMRYRRRD